MCTKEGKAFSPVPGFRGFLDDVKTKVIKYDPRAKSSEAEFYEPGLLEKINQEATQAVDCMMELVPEDLQRHMILTFDVKDGSPKSSAETNVASSSSQTEVKLQIDRSKLPGSSAPIYETLSMEGTNKELFVDIW